MARIAGVDLPREKRVEIGLTYVFGIGRKTSNEILAKTGINPDTRVKDLTEEEAAAAPASTKLVDIKAGKGKGVYKYTMAVSPLDCMGCGVCIGVCPTKSLKMVPQAEEAAQQDAFDYCVAKVSEKADMISTNSVKDSQFKKPLLEFSGSCAGCAETSYARLITQVCGDRMYISNATGCSSIWGGPAATSPYTVDANGHGPAWAN